jgi:hypothetical protein
MVHWDHRGNLDFHRGNLADHHQESSADHHQESSADHHHQESLAEHESLAERQEHLGKHGARSWAVFLAAECTAEHKVHLRTNPEAEAEGVEAVQRLECKVQDSQQNAGFLHGESLDESAVEDGRSGMGCKKADCPKLQAFPHLHPNLLPTVPLPKPV